MSIDLLWWLDEEDLKPGFEEDDDEDYFDDEDDQLKKASLL